MPLRVIQPLYSSLTRVWNTVSSVSAVISHYYYCKQAGQCAKSVRPTQRQKASTRWSSLTVLIVFFMFQQCISERSTLKSFIMTRDLVNTSLEFYQSLFYVFQSCGEKASRLFNLPGENFIFLRNISLSIYLMISP